MTAIENAETRLRALRAELTQRVAAVGRDFAAGRSADSEDRATETENAETLSALDDEARAEISQIDHALGRLAAGQYGVCENCGATIDAARLNAIPFATRCIRCADNTSH